MVSEQNIPSLTSIYFNPTDRCNLRCEHCWINPKFYSSGFKSIKKSDDELDVKEIEQIVKQSLKLGLKSIKLTGGEPFLRSDIYDIINLLKKYKLIINIETNGTLLTKMDINFLKKAKIDHISISLDGVTRTTHESIRGVDGSFERALNAIEMLACTRIPVEIIMSILSNNIKEFPLLFREAKRMGIRELKLNTIIPTGRGKLLYKKGLVPDIYSLLQFNKDIENTYSSDKNILVHLSIPPAFKSINTLRKEGNTNCKILNILGILSNGDISICGIGRIEKPLILGNVKKNNLEDIWRNHPFLNYLRSKLPLSLNGICNRCVLKGSCVGFCRANAFSVSGDILAPYWLCEEALNAGLFPKSRLL